MILLLKILSEVKRLPDTFLPDIGKIYDLKLWSGDMDPNPDYYEPIDHDWNTEGWYWFKDYEYEGIVNDKHRFMDSIDPRGARTEIDLEYLNKDTIRPHKD